MTLTLDARQTEARLPWAGLVAEQRRLLQGGPTVTARRTAAVLALAAQRLAPDTQGPLLIVGAGVQGKAHLGAFAAVLGTRQVMIASRSRPNTAASG